MGMNNERDPKIVAINIGTLAATTTMPAMFFRKKSRIKAVHLINQTGIAADNTNFLQVSLQTLAAVAVATVDTRAANQGAATAMTPLAFALSVPVGDTVNQPEAEVAAGTTLQLVVTKNGTGVPTLAQVQVEYYPL